MQNSLDIVSSAAGAGARDLCPPLQLEIQVLFSLNDHIQRSQHPPNNPFEKGLKHAVLFSIRENHLLNAFISLQHAQRNKI